jgi:lipoate-protein ligase A
VRLEGQGAARRIREVLLTGDFFVTPPRMVFDLESSLRGALKADAGGAVDAFFQRTKPDLLTIAPQDFRKVIEDAIARDVGA